MWSQIQRKLYEIIDPKINLQVHCAVYPGGGKTCANGIPRFWVTLDGEVIFDCMHDFMFMWHDKDFNIGNLPFQDDISWCCGIVIRHFQAPVDRLMTLHDRFGLTDILLAADASANAAGRRSIKTAPRLPARYSSLEAMSRQTKTKPSSKPKFRMF
jgi:hypothetical protein